MQANSKPIELPSEPVSGMPFLLRFAESRQAKGPCPGNSTYLGQSNGQGEYINDDK